MILMKKSILKILISSCFITLVGCNDFLEQEPGTQISIREQLATREGILQALSGLYSKVENTLRTETYTVYADLQGGNLKFTPVASGSNTGQITVPPTVQNYYDFNDTALDSDLEAHYGNCYQTLNAANLILENLDDVPDLSEAERDQIYAEALTLRGFMHFILVQMYAQDFGLTSAAQLGIVYKTESLQTELQYAPRLTLTETYAAIVSDFNTAIDAYKGLQLLEGPAYSYLNQTSAKALLARVYLYSQDWQNAYDLAVNVIETSGVDLTPKESYIDSWEQPLAPLSETLLELSVPRDTDGLLGGSLAATYGISSQTSYGNYVASEDLLDLYVPEDIRADLFIPTSLLTLENEVLVDQDYYFTKKFQGEPGTPVIRLSELYLIAAEAAYELNNTEAALAYLNPIRERANLSTRTEASDLESLIFLERRRELAFERHLFYDLKRTGRDVVRNDGCISQNCSLDYPSNFFVLPIPQRNLNLNVNLIQNEGY